MTRGFFKLLLQFCGFRRFFSLRAASCGIMIGLRQIGAGFMERFTFFIDRQKHQRREGIFSRLNIITQ